MQNFRDEFKNIDINLIVFKTHDKMRTFRKCVLIKKEEVHIQSLENPVFIAKDDEVE